MQLRLFVIALEFPGRNVGEVFVITCRFAVCSLMLSAEVTTTRLLTSQGVFGEKFTELEEVGNTASILKLRVNLFLGTAHADILP